MRRSSKQVAILAAAYLIFRLWQGLKLVLLAVIVGLIAYTCTPTAYASPASTQHPENHCPAVSRIAAALVQVYPADPAKVAVWRQETVAKLSGYDPIMTGALYVKVIDVLQEQHDYVVEHRAEVMNRVRVQALANCYLIMREVV